MVIKQPPNIHDIKAMDTEESKTEDVNADDPDADEGEEKEDDPYIGRRLSRVVTDSFLDDWF